MSRGGPIRRRVSQGWRSDGISASRSHLPMSFDDVLHWRGGSSLRRASLAILQSAGGADWSFRSRIPSEATCKVMVSELGLEDPSWHLRAHIWGTCLHFAEVLGAKSGRDAVGLMMDG
jgi:hypothetical protein